jgi:hypothetical protein
MISVNIDIAKVVPDGKGPYPANERKFGQAKTTR